MIFQSPPLIFISIALNLVIFVSLSFRHSDVVSHLRSLKQSSYFSNPPESPVTAAANSTLGFEKLFALSKGTEWRVHGIQAAANLTGLDIEILPQPPKPPELVQAFEHTGPEDATHPQHGSALAWIAHLDLLKHILQSQYTTAFIMEDDADWDVELRSEIMLPLADGVRTFTNAMDDDQSTPYGGNWDVLWLGHCGEWSQEWMPFHAWQDETVVLHAEYISFVREDLKTRLPEGVRTAQPTTGAVCTFGYGVTSEGARKILEHVGAGVGEAFDIALATACREKQINCVTVLPEVFQQYKPPSGDGVFSEVDLAEYHGTEGPHISAGTNMGLTANIKNSARCRALFDTTCQERFVEDQTTNTD